MTQTPAADPFLRAVIAAPDDDLPRLIYADALDAGDCPGVPRDPERAEFIRVQVELARLGDDGLPVAHNLDGRCACRLCALRRREYDFLVPDGTGRPCGRERWSGPAATLLHRLPRRGWSEIVCFRRGFASQVTCTAADWLVHADDLLAACPIRGKRYDEKPHYREPSRDGLVWLTDLEGWRVEVRPTDWHPTVAASVTVWDGGGREVATFAVTRAELARRDGALPSDRELVGRALAERWPGVRFELPAAPNLVRRYRDDARPGNISGRVARFCHRCDRWTVEERHCGQETVPRGVFASEANDHGRAVVAPPA